MSSPLSRRAMLALGGGLAARTAPPNILWITCEDLSPVLGCYGDRYAATPNLDRLAAQSVRYTHAFSTASVCTPSRSCLITGVRANTLGTMHLRGEQPLPAGITGFPEYLRRAGYYTSNNFKEDYNFTAPAGVWDESGNQAHYRKRRAGQPFFSVFNLMATHQGQIRYPRAEFEKINAALPPELRHDPARAPLPPYYPDTALTRLNAAELYTQATLMDREVGRLLRELEDEGLADSTIVFFYSDHGTGLPRGKRHLHESGTRVPLLIRQPGRRPGVSDRMVSFVDFSAEVLSLAGVRAPSYLQGRPFAQGKREYVYFASDRVDEVIETCRSVRNRRYQYIRNFYPHRPRLQHSEYSELGHVRKEIRRLAAEGALTGDQALLAAETTPAEELYDLQSDPHQVKNLAGEAGHKEVLNRLRAELFRHLAEIRDTGLLPEPDMMERAGGRSPKEMAFPVERILAAADLVGRGAPHEARLRELLRDPDAAVRYWAVVGLRVLEKAVPEMLDDASVSVRIAAAEMVLRAGESSRARAALEKEVVSADPIVALQAAVVFWYLGDRARGSLPALQNAREVKGPPKWQRDYVQSALRKTLARFA